jgi:chorismate mutase/prephenate dehydratase
MAIVSKSNASMGFLGPEGSWTHQAALALQGECRALVAFSAEELFSAYAQRHVTKICIPYHSSLAGLTPYFDQTMALAQWWIEFDYRRPIEHSLVALQSVELDRVERVLGHPIALAEVAPWLAQHLGHARLEPVASGGVALESLRRIHQKGCVAVAPAPSSRLSGLALLLPSIPTPGPNVTSWWVLGDLPATNAPPSNTFMWWRVRLDQHAFVSMEVQLVARGCTLLEVFARFEGKQSANCSGLIKVPSVETGTVANLLKSHRLEFDLVGASPQ